MGNKVHFLAAAGVILPAWLATAEPVAFKVTGADGKPISGAAVAVYSRGMRAEVAHGTTDDKGTLSLDLNRKPEYDLAVHADGRKLYVKEDTKLAESVAVKLPAVPAGEKVAVLTKNGSGAPLFGGSDADVKMATAYTGEWQFDLETANAEVLIGWDKPDQAVIRRINIGQSFVAKKGPRKVKCRLACHIPDKGLILEY